MIEVITKNNSIVLIGENATENDSLTCKYIKLKNDRILWFHASKIPGSHVVLIPNEINECDENDIQISFDFDDLDKIDKYIIYTLLSSIAYN